MPIWLGIQQKLHHLFHYTYGDSVYRNTNFCNHWLPWQRPTCSSRSRVDRGMRLCMVAIITLLRRHSNCRQAGLRRFHADLVDARWTVNSRHVSLMLTANIMHRHRNHFASRHSQD